MPCHKRLKKGQQPAGIFQVFFLRVDVHILHGFQICPAAHALQRFFRYACAIGACGEGELLEEPTTVSPLRRDADSLTEQQKFLSEPTSIPGMRRRLSFDGLVKKIKDQIDYWDLIENENKDEIDNIVSIMVEVMSTKCEYFTISGKKYQADPVHQRYSQITCQTIEYVLECVHKCGSDIRNIKQYLVASQK